MSYIPRATQQKLTPLNQLSPAEFASFCESSVLSLIHQNPPTASIELLADKTQLDKEQVTGIFEAFCSLFYLFAKLGVKEAQFNNILEEAKLNPEFKESIAKSYGENRLALRALIEKTVDSKETHFKELHWRIDVEIAGKAKASGLVPKFLLNLVLNDKEKEKSMLLESNYANLKRIKEELQNAVAATNSSYGRKVSKYAK